MPKLRLINTDKIERLVTELSKTKTIINWIELNDLKNLLQMLTFEKPFIAEDVIVAFETWVPPKAQYRIVVDRQTVIFIKVPNGSLFSSILMNVTHAIKFDIHVDKGEAILRLVWEPESKRPMLPSS